MKQLKVLVLALAIWSMGLIWPDVNLLLTPQVLFSVLVGIVSLLIGYIWFGHRLSPAVSPTTPIRPRTTTDTHPIKPVGLA